MVVVILMVKRKKKRSAESDYESDEDDYASKAAEMSVEEKIDVIKDSRQQKMKDVIQDFSTSNVNRRAADPFLAERGR